MRVALDLPEGIASEKVWSVRIGKHRLSGHLVVIHNVQDSGLAENPLIGYHMRSILGDSRHESYSSLWKTAPAGLLLNGVRGAEDESYG